MTGPEHYQAAESCLEDAYEAPAEQAGYHLQRAQVHAALALAAAYGTQCGDMNVVEPIGDKWRAVAS